MDKCYLCGLEDGKTLLYEGIHKKFGIVKVCRKCFHKDKLPLIEKKEIDVGEVEKSLSVRERLSRMAHVDLKTHEERRIRPSAEDVGLKELVEKNFKRDVEVGPLAVDDLVDNFNWVIMRRRRAKKLTRGEFADAIMEQPLVVESLENGKLPRDYVPLIKKVENFLGVRLLKRCGGIKPEAIIAESKVPSGILVEELKEKTEEKRSWFGGRKEVESEEAVGGRNISDKSLDELSDDDINDLIWGRK